MKKVYICSPLKGIIKTEKQNIQQALRYCRFAYKQGYNPFAPHVYYTQFLKDSEDKERKDGMRMGQEWMWAFQELWVFGLRRTDGMIEEIELARILGIKIRYFNEYMEELYDD